MQYVKKKKSGIAESRYFSCYTALQYFSGGKEVWNSISGIRNTEYSCNNKLFWAVLTIRPPALCFWQPATAFNETVSPLWFVLCTVFHPCRLSWLPFDIRCLRFECFWFIEKNTNIYSFCTYCTHCRKCSCPTRSLIAGICRIQQLSQRLLQTWLVSRLIYTILEEDSKVRSPQISNAKRSFTENIPRSWPRRIRPRWL